MVDTKNQDNMPILMTPYLLFLVSNRVVILHEFVVDCKPSTKYLKELLEHYIEVPENIGFVESSVGRIFDMESLSAIGLDVISPVPCYATRSTRLSSEPVASSWVCIILTFVSTALEAIIISIISVEGFTDDISRCPDRIRGRSASGMS